MSDDRSPIADPFDAPPPDPLVLLHGWVAAAREAGVREPLTVTLATSGRDGRVTSRTVVLRAVDGTGVLLTSMRTSAKGRQMAENPWAAVTLYWRETSQQVNLAGPVTVVDGEPADAMFAAQPRAAQVATALSVQGRALTDEDALRHRARELRESPDPVPRPAGWVGYRIAPEHVELWQGSPDDRLHRRLRYERTATDTGTGWTASRLQP
ncbi:MAG TPA: pyridoxal 5'-phosphate synthase [Cellulomonas sp.]